MEKRLFYKLSSLSLYKAWNVIQTGFKSKVLTDYRHDLADFTENTKTGQFSAPNVSVVSNLYWRSEYWIRTDPWPWKCLAHAQQHCLSWGTYRMPLKQMNFDLCTLRMRLYLCLHVWTFFMAALHINAAFTQRKHKRCCHGDRCSCTWAWSRTCGSNCRFVETLNDVWHGSTVVTGPWFIYLTVKVQTQYSSKSTEASI